MVAKWYDITVVVGLPAAVVMVAGQSDITGVVAELA
jgi:hypothetical protein